MITLDSSDKYAIIDVTTRAFHLENGVVTLQIDPDDYAITGRDIYAVFGETGITTGFLSVVDGIIQLPITQGLVVYGYNNFQLHAQVHGTTTVEDFNKMRWLVESSVIGTIPAPTDVDIITDLVAQVTATNNEAAASALEASGFADAASDSAAAALLSEQHAATSETNAGLSATAASGSALAASGSATAASNSAIAADNSADAALASEQAAEAAATANLLPATNVVVNGDFTNGVIGWVGFDNATTNIAESNVLQVTNPDTTPSTNVLVNELVSVVSGHTYYFRAGIKTSSNNALCFDVLVLTKGWTTSIPDTNLPYVPVQNTWYDVSANLVAIADGARFCIGTKFASTTDAGGVSMFLRYVALLDLTAAFGAGNEPTVEQMDRFIAKYPNSWFDGTENQLVSLKDAYLESTRERCTKRNVLLLGDSITQLGNNTNGWVKYFSSVVNPSAVVNVAVVGAVWRDNVGTVYDGNPVFGGADNNLNNVIGNQVEKIKRGKDTTHPNYVYVADYTDFDIIMIAAGTNDGVTDETSAIEAQFEVGNTAVPLANVDRTTWTGAIRYAIETLQTLYPAAEIYLCTPIQAADATRTYASTKSRGDVIKSVCNRISCEYIDTFECGICSIYEVAGAAGKYLADGLHPNNTGAALIGRYNAKEVIRKYIV